MRTNQFIKSAALLLLCLALFSCGKEKLGKIYGTVTDFSSGEPIANANVRLNPRGETTLTGSDGTFQFNDVADGTNSLSISRNGYLDLDDNYVIDVENGNSVQRDVSLRSQQQTFRITINGTETDTIDFGKDPSFDRINFTIENNGTVAIDVNIRESVNWLSYYSTNSNNHIEPNDGITPYAKVSRSFLDVGENIGYIYISSGTLTKTLVVKAQGLSTPVISEPNLTIQTYTTQVRASVIDNGGWQITDKGFEYYGYSSNYINKISCGAGNNNFQAQIPSGIGTTIACKVRAYAYNGVYYTYTGWYNCF